MKLVGITEVYSQDQDSCGPTEDSGQDLTLEVTDAGGGPYLVINTTRWAIEDAAEVTMWANKMKAMLKRVAE